jgi:CRP-like cAMP-binding protein
VVVQAAAKALAAAEAWNSATYIEEETTRAAKALAAAARVAEMAVVAVNMGTAKPHSIAASRLSARTQEHRQRQHRQHHAHLADAGAIKPAQAHGVTSARAPQVAQVEPKPAEMPSVQDFSPTKAVIDMQTVSVSKPVPGKCDIPVNHSISRELAWRLAQAATDSIQPLPAEVVSEAQPPMDGLHQRLDGALASAPSRSLTEVYLQESAKHSASQDATPLIQARQGTARMKRRKEGQKFVAQTQSIPQEVHSGHVAARHSDKPIVVTPNSKPAEAGPIPLEVLIQNYIETGSISQETQDYVAAHRADKPIAHTPNSKPARTLPHRKTLEEDHASIPTLSADNVRMLEQAFASIDSDGSGTLDRDEVHRLLCLMGKQCSETELDEYMFELDTHGGDGLIDFDEFKKYWAVHGGISELAEAIATWTACISEVNQISMDAMLSSFDTPSDDASSDQTNMEDRALTRMFCQSVKPLTAKRSRWRSMGVKFAASRITSATGFNTGEAEQQAAANPDFAELPLSAAELEEAAGEASRRGCSYVDEAAAAGLDPSSPAAMEWLAAKLFAVDSVDTFAAIDKRTKEKLVEVMPLVKFEPRQTVVTEGHQADGFFFIMRGVVQVSMEVNGVRQNFGQLTRPAYFGELGLIASSGGIRSATITAVGVTELLFLKYVDFQRTLGDRVETIKWKKWIGEAERRKDAELALGYHKVVCRIYETMLSRGIALFQEISSHEHDEDEADEDDSIAASNICSWLLNKHQELVSELRAVQRTPEQVSAEITLDLGDTRSKVISPLQFARNLPKLALQARKLCVCDDMRFHQLISHIYDRMASQGTNIFMEINNSDMGQQHGDGTIESDDLELWLTQQPHLMHEIIKVGSKAIEVGEIITEQLGGAKDSSITMVTFASKVSKLTAAAHKVLERAGVAPLEYDYSQRKVDYGF